MAIAEKLNTPEKALKNTEKDLYPNIHVLLLLAATIPGTSYECERFISNAEIDQNSFEKYNDPGEAKWISHDHQIPLKADELIEEFTIRHPPKLLL